MAKERHRTIIDSDHPIEVVAQPKDKGWWFKVFHSWIDSGWFAEISANAAKILIVLAKHANQDRLCWPGMSLMMRESGLPRSSVYVALNQLEACKLIERRTRGYGIKSTTYEIKEPKNRPATKTGPRAGTIQNSGPVQQTGQSHKLSQRLESIQIEGNRSNSELEELKPSRQKVTGEEVEAWADLLSVDEAEELKQQVLELASDVQKKLLAHRSVKSPGLLRALAYQLFKTGALH